MDFFIIIKIFINSRSGGERLQGAGHLLLGLLKLFLDCSVRDSSVGLSVDCHRITHGPACSTGQKQVVKNLKPSRNSEKVTVRFHFSPASPTALKRFAEFLTAKYFLLPEHRDAVTARGVHTLNSVSCESGSSTPAL